MPNRRWSVLLFTAVICASLGCGSGPTTTVRNQPAPPSTASVSIAFKAVPASPIFVSTTPSLAAVVTNDPLNAGVDWKVAPCQSQDCGSLSALHTASGQPVMYTPPANLTTNSLSVKILAFATADRSKNLIAPITIVAFSTALKGTYVLQTSGLDVDIITGTQDVAQFAGVVVLDGSGGVTAGEQTYTNTSRSVSDTITGGSYFIGSDGRGTLTLNTADPNIGQAGIETFNIVVLSPTQAFIVKNDPINAPIPSNETGTGTMDLQTSVNPLSQGYAFVVVGTDLATSVSVGGTSPSAVGGVLNIDSPNTISGAGSVADQDLPAVPALKPSAPISGTVSGPDAFGAVKFRLSTTLSPTPMLFTGYIIDASHIKLIETDVDAVNLTGASASGVAVGQGVTTGTFVNPTQFAGNYVFGMAGQDAGLVPSSSSLTSAGTFTAQAGNLTSGFNEAYFGDLFVGLVDQFQAPCLLDKNGSGRLDCHLTYTVNGAGPEYIFYQTGNGNPALVLDADSNSQGSGVAIGAAYQVSTPASFNGDYGMRFTQYTGGSQIDLTGQFNASGPAQILAGTVDANTSYVNPGPDGVTGTFMPGSSPNVLRGSLTDSAGFLVPNTSGAVNVDLFFIDPNHGFLIETDLNDPVLQGISVAFGSFATRIPLCQGCP